MGKKISEKEKALARLVIERSTGAHRLPAYKCYMQVYSDNCTKRTALSAACTILRRPHVRQYIGKLQGNIMRRHNITIDSLIDELEEARQLALKGEPESGTRPSAAPAVAATMGKAKLCGLDKQVIDHVSSDGSMYPKMIEIVAKSVKNESDD
jgi:hypothetical protein